MVSIVLRFQIWFVMTVYCKMWQLFYYNTRQKFITKCVRFFYYKMRQFYYKMRQLLQNATFITNCDSTAALIIQPNCCIAVMDQAADPLEVFLHWQLYLMVSSFLFLFLPTFLTLFCYSKFMSVSCIETFALP